MSIQDILCHQYFNLFLITLDFCNIVNVDPIKNIYEVGSNKTTQSR